MQNMPMEVVSSHPNFFPNKTKQRGLANVCISSSAYLNNACTMVNLEDFEQYFKAKTIDSVMIIQATHCNLTQLHWKKQPSYPIRLLFWMKIKLSTQKGKRMTSFIFNRSNNNSKSQRLVNISIDQFEESAHRCNYCTLNNKEYQFSVCLHTWQFAFLGLFEIPCLNL